jgi:hypothetical protein
LRNFAAVPVPGRVIESWTLPLPLFAPALEVVLPPAGNVADGAVPLPPPPLHALKANAVMRSGNSQHPLG